MVDGDVVVVFGGDVFVCFFSSFSLSLSFSLMSTPFTSLLSLVPSLEGCKLELYGFERASCLTDTVIGM